MGIQVCKREEFSNGDASHHKTPISYLVKLGNDWLDDVLHLLLLGLEVLGLSLGVLLKPCDLLVHDLLNLE